jgi:hypothetical protein
MEKDLVSRMKMYPGKRKPASPPGLRFSFIAVGARASLTRWRRRSGRSREYDGMDAAQPLKTPTFRAN